MSLTPAFRKDRLKEQNEAGMLNQLQLAVETKDRRRNKQHEVWNDSFDWNDCRSDEFIKQKLDYMHNNPCKGKWNLANRSEEYLHSSACFYLTGEQGYYPITSYMKLKDVALSRLVE